MRPASEIMGGKEPVDAPRDLPMLREVLTGLRVTPKRLPCKYLYDTRGSQLFEAITRQPEYYPTQAEIEILTARAPALARRVGAEVTLIEFGGGASDKSGLLLRALRAPSAFYALDIDAHAVERGLKQVLTHAPGVRAAGFCCDFTALERLPAEIPGMRRLGYFAGSTIGNFEPPAACDLLRAFRRSLGDGSHLLVGVDLIKPLRQLLPAYDDAAGWTAAFNLNLLERLNRELGANFDAGQFRHEVRYDDARARIEMHLVSGRTQCVRIADEPVRFCAGESIHTESSHKYSTCEFQMLARAAGWEPEAIWFDARRLFSLHLLAAA
ncbi:MAG: L-histidine N(alpha)-methyltransferase [Gammaproteobacteria bacterium]